jgi:hypothetical protein
MTTPPLCTRSDLRPMRATIINHLAAQAGMTTEVRAESGGAQTQPEAAKKDSSTKRSQRSQRGIWVHPRSRILARCGQLILCLRQVPPSRISVLLTLNFAHFREDSSPATGASPRRSRRDTHTPIRSASVVAAPPRCGLRIQTLSTRSFAELVAISCGLDSPAVALTNCCDFYVHGYLPTL